MNNLSEEMKAELLRFGADIAGFGDLSELPEELREGLPVGICVAVAYPGEVIRGIAELPTLEYREWYDKLNERLDMIVTRGAEALCEKGYRAIAQTREHVGTGNYESRLLPHKTVATRAGIGWIGKSALLVTEKYGSAVRLSSIYTDAPLMTAQPVNDSRCGDCLVCTGACPAGAVLGNVWEAGMKREDLLDAASCRKKAQERSMQGFGGDMTICGKCIEVCPHTRHYIYE